jgi:hypothetical protein
MRGVTLYFSGRQAGTSSGGLAIQAAAPPDEARSFRPPRSKFGGKVVEGGFSSPKWSMVGRQVKINPASLSQDKTGTSRVRLLALRGRHAKGRQGSFGGIAISNSINAR